MIPKRFRCFLQRDRVMYGALYRRIMKAVISFDRAGRKKPKATPGPAHPTSLRTLAAGAREARAPLADPLPCPACGGPMDLVAFILEGQEEVIERILSHLAEDVVPPPPTGPPRRVLLRQMAAHCAAHPEVLQEDDIDPPHPPDEAFILDEIFPDDCEGAMAQGPEPRSSFA